MSEILAMPGRSIHPSRAVSRLALATILILGLAVFARSQGPGGSGRDTPARPLVVWPPGPLEVIATFERPVDPSAAKAMVGRTIPYHDPATGGSRPAGSLRIVGARLADEGRTLILATDPHPRVAQYRLLLADATTSYDLSGVAAAWSEPDDPGAGPKWSGWWPSLDLDATRRLIRASRPHETGLDFLSRPGLLLLNAWVRLPAGKVAFRVESSAPFEEFTLGDAQSPPTDKEPRDGLHRSEVAVESRGEPLFLTLSVRTGAGRRPISLRATYRPSGEPADRALERDRLLVPWAPVSTDATIAAPVAVPDLSGGDPERGRSIFRGDQARCAQCHAFRGEGGQVGPDLTSLATKGRAEIYRSIAAPSAIIEPDYTTYTVATRDGQVFSGVARADGPDQVRVTDSNARATTVRRDEIQEIRPSATSIMPPGLAAALGDSAVRDLIAYLTSPAPQKPPAGRASP